MAEKDITEKILISCADVFADCINALVFEGEQKLEPGDLQHAPTESFYHIPPIRAAHTGNRWIPRNRYIR